MYDNRSSRHTLGGFKGIVAMRHFIVILFIGSLANTCVGQSQPTPAASALTSMFSPERAPQRKTMGLLQRSFLDLAGEADRELEVAIVVDGTESMASELAGVRQSIQQMIDDLRRFRQNEVRVALVIYRDAQSPSGPVTVALERFTASQEAITKAVQSLQPEPGAPYFHELPDLGVHTALSKLPWSDDPQVSKWILLFGDAPPYRESFQDPNNPDARRRYGNELLIAIAQRKNIRINCVLCTSSENVVEPYDQALSQTRAFMEALAQGTDGLMLDLSYPDIRAALIESAKQPAVQYAQIQPITSLDVAAAARGYTTGDGNRSEVRIAVIPHDDPISAVSFDPRRASVQVATALRHRLGSLPGVRVASTNDIKRQLRRMQADGISDDNAIRGLAARLGVDYVVWGKLEPQTARYQTAAYRKSDGKKVVQVSFGGDNGKRANVLLTAAAQQSEPDQAIGDLYRRMQSSALQAIMNEPLADDADTSGELLAALEALEQSLAQTAGSEESAELLEKARASSEAAIAAEPRNALGHWLRANVAFNQAAAAYRQGDTETAKSQMLKMKSALRRAVRERREIESPSLIAEIEADHELLINADYAAAIKKYQSLTALDQPLASQLRGHWMLAGIYAGDWGVEKEFVDATKTREHIIQILANWPTSPEAELLKRWLQWNEETEKTRYNHVPKMHLDLSKYTEA